MLAQGGEDVVFCGRRLGGELVVRAFALGGEHAAQGHQDGGLRSRDVMEGVFGLEGVEELHRELAGDRSEIIPQEQRVAGGLLETLENGDEAAAHGIAGDDAHPAAAPFEPAV